MDEDENNAISREELLRQFRDSLSKPMSERYFDEDSLIDIFDYAGDLGDDYLRMEALMCGARFFPDSEELLERRGIFYSNYSDRARQQFLELGQQGDGIIFDLLALRDAPPTDSAELRRALDGIIERSGEILDEELIQLVETVNELGMYPWIKERYPIIAKKATYKQGLLYEMAMLAESFGDIDGAIAYAEELTEVDAFNSYYWMVLGRLYLAADNTEAALSAVDYSLAINTEMPESLYLKARIIYKGVDDFEPARQLCLKAMESSKGNIDVARFYASLYRDRGDDAAAIGIIRSVLDDPDKGLDPPYSDPLSTASKEIELIPELILLGADDSDALLDRFYAASPDNSARMWTTWAAQLNAVGRRDVAQKVIQAFERNSGQHTNSLIAAEQDFRAGRYLFTINTIDLILGEPDVTPAAFPSAVLLKVLSLIKLRRFAEAHAIVEMAVLSPLDSTDLSASLKLQFYAYNDIMKRLYALMRQEPPVPQSFWDTYNPLSF